MCLIKVKEEEDYTVPARVVRRPREPSPRRSTRIIIDERRPSPRASYVVPAPAPGIILPPPEPERIIVEAPPPRASARYVEVVPSSSSSSSSEEDVRSRTTSKSRNSRTTAPRSEYHLREREYRRERGYTPPRQEYETYRYIDAPARSSRDYSRDRRSTGARGSYADDPRASRTSYRRERMVIVDEDGRRTREYRR